MWSIDPETGRQRWYRSGEAFEADDATQNTPVVIPWEVRGNPCSEKFGVIVSRFQWLLSVDRASRFIPAFNYTVRPKSSYRGEDVLALMQIIGRDHCVPDEWVFEQGVWKGDLVKQACQRMNARLHTVHSPHTKAFIEGLFNTLWTKLSVNFPEAHVGRSQGEERQASLLLESCKRGHTDPSKHFPSLKTLLGAMEQAIWEKNRTPIQSDLYGTWVPEERWTADLQASPRRQLDASSAWMFDPFIRRWKVNGMQVGGRVRLFESLSVPLDFSAPELRHFHGANVLCHFDPYAAQCFATVILAEPWQGHPPGEIIATARQINCVASYARLVAEWADDPITAGLTERQRNNAAVRREVRSILPRSRRGASVSEARDGISTTHRIERDGGDPSTPNTNPHARGGGSAVLRTEDAPARPTPSRNTTPAVETYSFT
jgi:hypothetical protein